ncbi:hypothetical protein M408DRAFT_166387 [Serendipita vermifera MAFF 305830]|uniref:Uncharacterized protein n=1 Tax=Serendipita vermifera MAFF 305830 TaxID=933852 RepID=A0A0C2XEI7_SERVB|nr:hypothetical protein M408DRAFT_166387 [Serendipita vermifera MAFF 305830]
MIYNRDQSIKHAHRQVITRGSVGLSHVSPNAFSCPWTIFFNDGCLSFPILQNQKKVYREGGETVFPTGLEDVDEKKRSMIASSGRDERSTRVAHLPTPNTRTTTSFLVSPLYGLVHLSTTACLNSSTPTPTAPHSTTPTFYNISTANSAPNRHTIPKTHSPSTSAGFFFSFVIFSVFPLFIFTTT